MRRINESANQRVTPYVSRVMAYGFALLGLGVVIWSSSAFAQEDTSSRGYLYIVTYPPGATIKIDGELVQRKDKAKDTQKQISRRRRPSRPKSLPPREIDIPPATDEAVPISSPVPLTRNAKADDRRIAVRTIEGFNIGDTILIQQGEGKNRKEHRSEVIRLAKVDLVPTLFLRLPLQIAFRSGNLSDPAAARIFKIQPPRIERLIAVTVATPTHLEFSPVPLIQDARAGEDRIVVKAVEGFDIGDTILIQQGKKESRNKKEILKEHRTGVIDLSEAEGENSILFLRTPLRDAFRGDLSDFSTARVVRVQTSNRAKRLEVAKADEFRRGSSILIQEIDQSGLAAELGEDAQRGSRELLIANRAIQAGELELLDISNFGPHDVIHIVQGVVSEDLEIREISAKKLVLEQPLQYDYQAGKAKIYRVKITETAEIESKKDKILILKQDLRHSFSTSAQVFRLTSVQVEHPFYLPQRHTVLITKGEITEITVGLSRGTGDITIISNPVEAAITLEPQFSTQASILETPAFTLETITDIPAGEYRLKLISGNYVRDEPVNVERGGTTVIEWKLQKDRNPPRLSGDLLINSDDRQTSLRDVSLSFEAIDEIGVDKILISNDENFTEVVEESYLPQIGWKLPPAPGRKNVWVKFKDRAGNVSEPHSAEIELIPPVGMVYIPAAENFEPGIELGAYYIDQFEVTNAQYKEFINATGNPAPDYWSNDQFEVTSAQYKRNYPVGMADYPVVYVTWNDAQGYASWLGKRLPTEAEWERAASGSKLKKEPPKWAWGNRWNGVITNFVNLSSGAGIMPVDRFPKGKTEQYGPYNNGIYNMSGNVWEWVDDWYDSDNRAEKVIRGGLAIDRESRITTLTHREKATPTSGYGGVGFRCVLPINDN